MRCWVWLFECYLPILPKSILSLSLPPSLYPSLFLSRLSCSHLFCSLCNVCILFFFFFWLCFLPIVGSCLHVRKSVLWVFQQAVLLTHICQCGWLTSCVTSTGSLPECSPCLDALFHCFVLSYADTFALHSLPPSSFLFQTLEFRENHIIALYLTFNWCSASSCCKVDKWWLQSVACCFGGCSWFYCLEYFDPNEL